MLLDILAAITNFQFEEPNYLWGIPIAALLLLLLLSRDFVKAEQTDEERKRQRRKRVWVFVARLLIITCLLIALAQPYTEESRDVKGNPRLTILADRSGSMAYLETGFLEELAASLDSQIPTTLRSVGTNLSSDLGTALLQNLEEGGNILLLSDARPTHGPQLTDVAFYANTLNATISTLNLTAKEQESAVLITGPGKVMAESEAAYQVAVTSTDPTARLRLRVTVDGAQALDKEVAPGTYPFTKKFAKGSHRIEASITTTDQNRENDRHYKTVEVLPKPKVLLITTKSSPIELLLRELYEVEKRATLPADLSPYYAIIANDVPVERLANTQGLHDFLIDEEGGYYGGGAVFFAGLDSFDRGGYHATSLESLLPVTVGQGERQKGEANLVFVVDVSGSTARVKYRQGAGGQAVAYEEAVSTLDVVKAQLVNAVEQLKLKNRVGVIVFGVPADVGRGVYDNEQEMIADTVRVVQPLDHLFNNRQEILEKVPRIQGGGPSSASIAFKGAIDMLRNKPGDKNIILMTDGRYSAGLGMESPMKKEMRTLASNAHRLYGINFMTIGTGTTNTQEFAKKVDEQFLKELAKAGDGTYDRATQLNTLLVKWGDPKAKEFGQEFILVPLSLTHFITEGIEPSAILNGYSQVVPKDTAELLITTDAGDPALTTWRYGNGRVATWTVFAGNNLGQLLNDKNSLLVSRTINWAIGDPQRKEAYYVDIGDIRINEEGIVRVRSDKAVTSDALEFSKEGEFFVAPFQPTELGFGSIMGTEYAVNRPREFDQVGVDPIIRMLTENSGGKVFKPTQEEEIIQHVKESSRRVIVERQVLALPFLWAALALLLLEILARRLTNKR